MKRRKGVVASSVSISIRSRFLWVSFFSFFATFGVASQSRLLFDLKEFLLSPSHFFFQIFHSIRFGLSNLFPFCFSSSFSSERKTKTPVVLLSKQKQKNSTFILFRFWSAATSQTFLLIVRPFPL